MTSVRCQLKCVCGDYQLVVSPLLPMKVQALDWFISLHSLLNLSKFSSESIFNSLAILKGASCSVGVP